MIYVDYTKNFRPDIERLREIGRLSSENGLIQQLTKDLLERALNGEMMHHLGRAEKTGEILFQKFSFKNFA